MVSPKLNMILLTDPLQKGNALNKKLTSMVSPKLNMILLTDPLQKGNALNNQFYLVFTPVSNISRTDFNKQCNMPASTQHPKISHLAIKTDDIQKLLCNLNSRARQNQTKTLKRTLCGNSTNSYHNI
jgi:5S rRNA maturation endonuclease (ribonuclease M5)